MKAIARLIVKGRIFLFILFLIMAVFFGILLPKRGLTFDIFKLLPRDMESLQGIEILNNKVLHGPDWTILCKNDDQFEVERLVERLNELPFVSSVSWLGERQDISLPKEMWNESYSTYYKDGNYKIQVSINPSKTYKSQIDELRRILPSWASLTGTEVIAHDMEVYFKGSTLKYFLLGILLVSVFLLLAFPNIWGPIFIVFSMIVGVIINLGISTLIGTKVYYIVDTLAAILQVAVTLDYSLFLFHRYEEERASLDKEKAMEEAILGSLKPILLSSLTTLAGFFALTFARLGFYTQAGEILIRGVLISTITTVVLLASLLVIFDRLVSGRKHRIIPIGVGNLGRFIGKHLYIFIVVFIFLLGMSYYSSSRAEPIFDQNLFLPSSIPSIATLNDVNRIFGGVESIIIVTKEGAKGLESALNELKKVPEVKGISSYFNILDPALPIEFLPERIFKRFNGGGYTFASILIDRLGEKEWIALRAKISRLLKENIEGEVYITGESVLLRDVKEVSEEDQTKASRISFYLILLIVALGFLSFSVPPVLVAIIQTAIWLNIGYYFLFHISMPFFIPTLLSTIQLGSTIDYSVLLTSRYEEERRNGLLPIDAINEAVHWSSHSIITSAGTMLLMNLPVAILSDIKLLSLTMASLARGAFLSLLVVTFLLPGVLVGFDKIFRYTTYRWSKEVEENEKN